MTLKELESRLAALEREVERLRAQLPAATKKEPWWISEAGRFENDPVFDEIVRLGKEYRESLRPGHRRKKKRVSKTKAAGNNRAHS